MKLKNKKGGALIFILIFLILIVAAVGIYFLFFTESQCTLMNYDDSFCVDNLPDFPVSIGGYQLIDYNKKIGRLIVI